MHGVHAKHTDASAGCYSRCTVQHAQSTQVVVGCLHACSKLPLLTSYDWHDALRIVRKGDFISTLLCGCSHPPQGTAPVPLGDEQGHQADHRGTTVDDLGVGAPEGVLLLHSGKVGQGQGGEVRTGNVVR